MRLPRMAWEKGMERLVDEGWQLEKWRYCWWVVGLMWTEVWKSRLVNKDVNIQEGEMGRGDGPGKSDRVATIEALKEEEKGIMTMSQQQEDIINKPEPKVRFRVF